MKNIHNKIVCIIISSKINNQEYVIVVHLNSKNIYRYIYYIFK